MTAQPIVYPEVEKFRADVELFLRRTGLGPNKFGQLSCNDQAFTFKMRRGDFVGLKRMARVKAFMKNYKTGNGR